MIIFGILAFDYAFPDMSIQRSTAAILSMYCFSFATVTWFGYEMRKDKENENKE
jgi:hypothetical protein